MAMFSNRLHRSESAELNQAEAAELLRVTERTFWRWTRRYEEDGEARLLDRRLGKSSGKRVPTRPGRGDRGLYRERYHGYTEDASGQGDSPDIAAARRPRWPRCSGAVNAEKRLWRDRG
jgi:hypothetical protein